MHARVMTMPDDEITRSRRMFFFYFNKLGWLGSILVSIARTLVLILAFRLFNG